MPDSVSFPKLSYPEPRKVPEWGIGLHAFLEKIGDSIPEAQKPLALRQVFRWVLQVFGSERPTEEEIRQLKEKFYAVLPESLRSYYPWEPPQQLGIPQRTPFRYPHEHTPLRQYGLVALHWIEHICTLPESVREKAARRLARHLYSLIRQQGGVIEEQIVLNHIYLLSGEQLKIEAEGWTQPERRERPNFPRHRPPYRFRR
ncbi:MAG: hypothetical protein NZ580_04765 [Bacteroidia bacterium]|nr:hypothetical protein [Bacteroidia bacterium]MDW8236262.1 hypothetical protein [Bacteroidia bacterium]